MASLFQTPKSPSPRKWMGPHEVTHLQVWAATFHSSSTLRVWPWDVASYSTIFLCRREMSWLSKAASFLSTQLVRNTSASRLLEPGMVTLSVWWEQLTERLRKVHYGWSHANRSCLPCLRNQFGGLWKNLLSSLGVQCWFQPFQRRTMPSFYKRWIYFSGGQLVVSQPDFHHTHLWKGESLVKSLYQVCS